ncbi:MAG TPA: NADH-quinone oxidoreductase subunit NuoH [Candidatus Marinimicrobia bacterium]|mgnify:FL=1|jgi:NADH-quinone oxidoreductase subunit H|nr:NADH-quinone oxidoreductase subunit NuoH [Candidatus Neomarinimicrobiota bacterium]MDP7216838.1 NADH-quinone oxidoreductase subunit NuoH [Candidatus Neomarinimicrobiota bacterium]HJL73819.1 NADH-quinone oxidoreductase subunit NuoH [Candidatus Neomarinimicrobiota bacterium]HJM69855.1 NADH-quinone oxidoreductase subunit NuoH [Candidatus Neomarinimicrobiota bacterium]
MDLLGFIIILVKVLVVFAATMITVMGMIYAERRVSAFMQGRLGPNRVGPKGLLQPIADGIKFFMKEDLIPSGANKPIFILAPAILLIPALMTFAVIPFGSSITMFGREIALQVADVNVGILYILALTSIGVYGIVLAGWSSNSKYSLLGGLRSSAQLISYELAMGLAVVSIILLAGSLRLNDIIADQQGYFLSWNVFKQPLAFIIFLVAVYAETNRLPFDLTEAEQELVGGYHTEYSSLKFAMFFLAEYANMITAAALTVTLFFGGWDVPLLDESSLGLLGAILSVLSFILKMAFFLFLFIWVRWTFPRFRYDQLMRLGWKVLLPLALINIFLTGGYLTLTAIK